MPWLLIPLAILLLPVLVVAAWPLSLWWRYRTGPALRPVRDWQLALQAWLLLPALPMLLLGAWVAQQWWAPAATAWAAAGALAGIAIGVVRMATTRVGRSPDGLRWYTPERWIALALSLLVTAKVVWTLWQGWQAWQGVIPLEAWRATRATLFALGGLVLGQSLGYAWGLRWRLREGRVLRPRPRGR